MQGIKIVHIISNDYRIFQSLFSLPLANMLKVSKAMMPGKANKTPMAWRKKVSSVTEEPSCKKNEYGLALRLKRYSRSADMIISEHVFVTSANTQVRK